MDFIGIDIGGTAIKAVRIGADGTVGQSDEVPYSGTPEQMINQVAGLASSLRRPGTLGVGIGMAGLVRWPGGGVRVGSPRPG